jgi:hypothetical protein
MILNWNSIRALNGSQHEGFEELCCQLAGQKPPAAGGNFTRVGKPDGGKECFWQTPAGEVHAWQAKYFPTAFSDSQWAQIDRSVTDLIDHHPQLVCCTVCCPLDLPDGKVKGRTSLLAKWQAKVKAWEAYALAKGMSVTFTFWGSSELIGRLSKKANEGMRYFWFNQEEFTDSWFTYKNDESIAALGGRYTAELNFELPIAHCFDGLARGPEFKKALNKRFNKVFAAFRSLHLPSGPVFDAVEKSLSAALDRLKALYLKTEFGGFEKTGSAMLRGYLREALKVIELLNDELYDWRSAMEVKKPTPAYTPRHFSSEISAVQKLYEACTAFSQYLDSDVASLADLPCLLITGEAGAGKSHLLADAVRQRSAKGLPSLLLLGESFTTRTAPWSQILQHLLRKPAIDEHTLLGALDAKAEASGSRLLLMIDALNEGKGRTIWPGQLETFIKLVLSYPHLGLVLSIRDSYTELIAPAAVIPAGLAVRVVHSGFAEVSFEASVQFFKHYKIMQPGSPMLNPEFQNPLFLKLFCQSLYQKGLHTVPAGYTGITAIIDFYLEGINHKLALEWEFDEKLQLVRHVVEKVVAQMVDGGTDHLSYIPAAELAESIFQGKCARNHPWLERLLSEGVFNADLHWNEKGEYYDVVYFAYQRFQDHLIAGALLDQALNPADPKAAFASGRLHELVKDQKAVRLNRNLIEALSIQVPERTGLELFEVAPATRLLHSAAQSFVRSLIWRKAPSIGTAARDYVNAVILQDNQLSDLFMETAISTTMRPGFYFNGDSLHRYLAGMKPQERELEWTTWLQNRYGPETRHNAVQRLVDWAFDTTDYNGITDEAMALGACTLGWFLTSCNRYLRDTATKSLVRLLENRPELIVPLLEKFENASDLYINERLYAAAYGAALRLGKNKVIEELAAYTFQKIFDQKLVIAHDQLRDYARGIVELAAKWGMAGKLELKKARPPYRSKKIPARLPSVATIDRKYDPRGKNGHYGGDKWGATAILSSMTTEYGRKNAGYGDFGRYVFGYAFSDFDVDEALLSNYAVDLIFKMGYDPELFTKFDNQQPSGRGSGHMERIGKKYQWIVLHELLARVSDHCRLFESGHFPEDGTLTYEGPWDGSRDIDPSVILRKTGRELYSDHARSPWLRDFTQRWDQDNHEWIRDASGQPDPAAVVLYQDEHGVEWLWLNIHPIWTQPQPLGEDQFEGPYKEVWYLIRSYFVYKNEVDDIIKSVAKGFDNHQFDEAKSLSNVFDREFYDAPAYLHFANTTDPKNDWIDIHHRRTGKKIADLLRTTEVYHWEKEIDCSKEEPLIFNKASRTLATGLGLRYSATEGGMVDDDGEMVCFDPSVCHRSTSGLLIKKTAMDRFLEKEDLALIWTVVGEKQVNARNWHGKKYPGRMNMSGIYTYDQGKVSGELIFELD